jgi:hypothetical protein
MKVRGGRARDGVTHIFAPPSQLAASPNGLAVSPIEPAASFVFLFTPPLRLATPPS